ncbi:hypothetical protein L195_g042075 [Trifolium pratense]|uniref:Uncharacterized protein n=1 Tax=Trifolium pratense TaxID=57577 RepID=A0A2K3M5E5_TRIPR|nr:hypothetical protein L195_g042075 [Trifolium pratense]
MTLLKILFSVLFRVVSSTPCWNDRHRYSTQRQQKLRRQQYSLLMLWLNDVPSKVGMVGWRLLLAKLPTRAALPSRGGPQLGWYLREE